MEITITQDDIARATARHLDEERRLKKAFMHVKQLDFKKFRNFMNAKLTESYEFGQKEMEEAMSNTLQPKQIERVKRNLDTIKQWDDVDTIVVGYEEFDLYDLMLVVYKEMRRAAGIHGEEFKDYAEAKEAINEEIDEIWQAADVGDLDHAKVEAVQAIGVLVKFLRTVHSVEVDGYEK